jgi:hypothetical protein
MSASKTQNVKIVNEYKDCLSKISGILFQMNTKKNEKNEKITKTQKNAESIMGSIETILKYGDVEISLPLKVVQQEQPIKMRKVMVDASMQTDFVEPIEKIKIVHVKSEKIYSKDDIDIRICSSPVEMEEGQIDNWNDSVDDNMIASYTKENKLKRKLDNKPKIYAKDDSFLDLNTNSNSSKKVQDFDCSKSDCTINYNIEYSYPLKMVQAAKSIKAMKDADEWLTKNVNDWETKKTKKSKANKSNKFRVSKYTHKLTIRNDMYFEYLDAYNFEFKIPNLYQFNGLRFYHFNNSGDIYRYRKMDIEYYIGENGMLYTLDYENNLVEGFFENKYQLWSC